MKTDYREISPSESLFLQGASSQFISLYQECFLLLRELARELVRRDVEKYGKVTKETEEFLIQSLTRSDNVESASYSRPASYRPKPKGFAPK